MFRKQVLLLTLAVLISVSVAQRAELIDFTYSHVLPDVEESGERQGRFNIQPSFKSVEQLEFPHICELKQRLDEDEKDKEGNGTAGHSESNIQYLRESILRLLKLAEDIKAHRSMVAEIESEYNLKGDRANNATFDEDLKRLQAKEGLLAQQKQKINQLTTQLNALLDVYNNTPKRQQLKQISLKYNVAFAENKIAYYQQLRDDLLELQAHSKPFNYDIFFANLDNSFGKLSGQLDDIDSLIGNYTYRKKLQQNMANLRNKIQIDKLTLNQKRNCNHSKYNIRSRGHITDQIKKIFQDLREKKKQFKGMNNTHCQGVAKKLDQKIRNWLKIINRAYKCSENLTDVEQALADKEEDLRRMEEELARLKVGELQVYQRNYNRTVDEINDDISTMRSFTVDQYRHSIPHIEQLIERSKKQKALAEQEQRALPIGNGSKIQFNDLEQLVKEIKKEKAIYCRDYEAYQELDRLTAVKRQAFEKREMERAHVREQFFKYGNKILNLEEEYAILVKEILEKLSKTD